MENGIIIGAIFDGLKDRIASYPAMKLDTGKFYLSDVVLPEALAGKLLTGDESETSRICSGYSWPSEASIREYTRRVPISLAWRLLIDKGNRNVIQWNSTQFSSFKISKIISLHIKSLLKNAVQDFIKIEKIVISIPNDLDEIAQERLIRELANNKVCAKDKINLLWKPIALALEWLNNVQNNLHETIGIDDYIIATYIGADSFEFVPLRLRKREYDGKSYLIPLREIPDKSYKTSYSGVQWCAAIIEKIIGSINNCNNKKGAFWQLFTGIPDIWANFAHLEYKIDELPRAVNIGDSWTLWDPREISFDDILNKKFNIAPNASENLTNIVTNSLKSIFSNETKVFEDLDKNYYTVKELLTEKFKNALNFYKGKCHGIVISGPFSKTFADNCLPLLKHEIELKMGSFEISSAYRPNSILIEDDNILQSGAVSYGVRLINKQPTYLDTLTQIQVLVMENGKQKWCDLLNSDELEIEGGSIHNNILEGKFILYKGSNEISIYLHKTTEQNYRYKKYIFPYPPSRDVVFDTKIRISPASGTIQIEFIPDIKEFLAGTQIFLDYSEMAITDKLPELKLSYPDVEKPNDKNPMCDPLDSYISTSTTLDRVRSYVRCLIDLSDDNFKYYISTIKELSKRLKVKRRDPDSKKVYPMININGCCVRQHGNEIINIISLKIENDLMFVYNSNANEIQKHLSKFKQIINENLKLSSELFCSAPETTKITLKNLVLLLGKLDIKNYRIYLEAYKAKYMLYASRILTDKEDVKKIFESVQKIIKNPDEKKSLYSRAILNLLTMRENSIDVMDGTIAYDFLNYATRMLFYEKEKLNFRSNFFTNVGLIIYLLRFRKIDPTFLSPNKDHTKSLIEKLISYLKMAIDHVNPRNIKKLEELIEIIDKYMTGEGCVDTLPISILNDFIDDENDDDS